jgi:hypothetical protein
MPRVLRTVIPRIKKSLRERGLVASLGRSFLLPLHLLREYRAAKSLRHDGQRSAFDQEHGVDTDGEYEGWTYLSDLEIPSTNWIHGNNYAAIEPKRFERVIASLDIRFEDYTFVDFGSGKGRALLLASEFPFKRIVGLEFSPQLHAIAENNICRYRSATQKCTNLQSLNLDFVDFMLPAQPLILFFFDPCRVPILAAIMTRIGQSLLECPRPLYVAYVAPRPEHEQLFASSGFLEETVRSIEGNFCIYRGRS